MLKRIGSHFEIDLAVHVVKKYSEEKSRIENGEIMMCEVRGYVM